MSTTIQVPVADVLKHKDCARAAAEEMFKSVCGLSLSACNPAPSVAAKFAGFEIPFESQDMGDATGGLANIFAENAKALLDAKRVRVEISLPSVIRGQGVEVLKGRGLPSERWDYSSPAGIPWVEVIAGRGVAPIRKSGG